MQVHFLGTRGEIKPKTKRHFLHTAAIISYRRMKVMIDCGDSFRRKIWKISPHAIIITHAHPDHAFGLDKGSPCPVWATKTTWEKIKHYPIEKKFRKIIKEKKPAKICGITFTAFPVLHSIIAPAAGYRVTAGRKTIFYVPDLVWIIDRKEALHGAKVYIGDGATIKRNMVRKAKATGELIGHANVKQQITWCQKEGVPKMIITHCGSDIVAGNEKKILSELRKIGKAKGVAVEIAYDNWKVKI